MSLTTKLKHYTFAAVTALSPANPNKGGGNLGDAAGAIKDFVADLGVSASVKRQLVGIEQRINSQLVDLGPYGARKVIGGLHPAAIEQNKDCSIYDVGPSEQEITRSGALVFVKYFADGFAVVRDPVVEFVGFGRDMQSAWDTARKMPRLTASGQGQFQADKSYMLWYQFKLGKIESGKVPYPFYLSVVKT